MTITLVRHDRPMPAGQYVPGGGAVVRLHPTPAETAAMRRVSRAIVATALYGNGHHIHPTDLAAHLTDAVNDGI